MEENNKDIVQNNGQTGDVKPNEKTYTEQDIQNSFNAGVKKANSDWQKDEKYKEFLDWKKTNQNDSEKISELTNTNTNLTNEIKLLKAQIQVDNSDCKKEFSKFVTSEVMSLVNETNDFESALKDYKKNNPQYFGETVIKKVQTAPNLSGGTTPQTTNSIMNDIIRSARN
jgi:hypothetical protein